jgi:enoyl-CoA hydratase/carnithine racemase
VAVFTMNNPPVNQLSAQFRADLAEAFNEAFGDESVKAIVITGTGKNFIAGADITEIQHIKKKKSWYRG